MALDVQRWIHQMGALPLRSSGNRSRVQIEEIAHELIRVLGLDAVGCQCHCSQCREIPLIECDDDTGFAADSQSKVVRYASSVLRESRKPGLRCR